MPQSVAIIGAGIAGLTCAYRLSQRGFDVCLYERADRAGGPLRTAQLDGYLCELGPHTLFERTRSLRTLLDELGLGPARVVANPSAKRRFIVRDGRPVAVPAGPADLVNTPLLSPAARLRALAEPFVGAFDRPEVDESLANFVRRRLGPEVLDYLIDPFVAGTYAGDPRTLSARHAFPALHQLELEHGSLVRGMLARRLRGERDPNRLASTLLSFERGLGQLPEALVARVGEDMILEAAVTAVERREDGWHVTYRKKRRKTTHVHDAVLFALPAYALAGLDVRASDSVRVDTAALGDITYSPTVIVQLGYRRRDVAHPLDGFGMLVPRVENFHILGTLFVSTMFSGRAPEGHVNLSTFVGGARNPQLFEEDDAALVELTRADLGRLLGVRGTPTLVNVVRYEHAIPQFEVGYGHFLDHLDRLEADHPGLFFAGNYRDGIAVPAVLDRASDHADAITRYLKPRESRK